MGNSPSTMKGNFMEYGFGFETFKNKPAVVDRVRVILAKRGDIVDAGDIGFLADLILRHPRADEKIGAGIKGFSVRANHRFPKHGTLWLRRADGTATDFSYKQCLQPPTAHGRFCQAARHAIGYQINAFKRSFSDAMEAMYCPILDEWFPFQDMHVDHKPPLTFNVLVKDFIARENLGIEQVEYINHDGMIGNRFADRGLESRWMVFHQTWADMWVISEKAHTDLTKERRANNE